MDLKELHAKIGQLTLEKDFLHGALSKTGLLSNPAMIDRRHNLSITRQTQRMHISRDSVYYRRQPCSTQVQLVHSLDTLPVTYPLSGSHMHEEIHLSAYDSVPAARCAIAQYLEFYNSQRPHQAHHQGTPDEACFAALPFAQVQAA